MAALRVAEILRFILLTVPFLALSGGAPAAADPQQPAAASGVLETDIVYLGKRYKEPPPLSLVDVIATDKGIQGARIAIEENNTTGRLLKKHFNLVEAIVGEGDDIAGRAREVLAAGQRLIIADLEPADLLAVADIARSQVPDAVLLSIRSSDDELRLGDCRANVFHILPSYSMRTDALGQYLTWKKWRRWFLVSGQGDGDLKYAAALRRSAKKLGAKIVEERSYKFEAGSRRTDSGHQQVQTQMPLLTQRAAEHDVVAVADVSETFGDYLQYRTAEPKPVVGTHGLVAVAWHRSFEQYAAMQMQNRFEKFAKRVMTERDYSGWLAVRIFGEAVTRTAKNSGDDVKRYLLSKEFEVAGYKGTGLTFRQWDQQLRQPVLVSGARALVSISPQDGFLHERLKTDTLGYDQPESTCKLNR